MEDILEKCIFKKEWNDAKVEDVIEFAEKGKAKLLPTGDFMSFTVKESYQGDVKNLPTGARTLLLNVNNNQLIVRGVNKFFDIEDFDNELVNKSILWEFGKVWLQRKMAGFVVTLFSLDGENISLVSKHVVEGPHVNLARRILNETLTIEQQKYLALDLFSIEAAVSCECICTEEDPYHPMPEENKFNNNLIIFSVHKRSDLREISIPFEKIQSMAKRWGLRTVPAWYCNNEKELNEYIEKRESWIGIDPDDIPLAEGYVLVVNLPLTHLIPSIIVNEPFNVVSLRFKAKTVKYRILRSLRSIISGESLANPYLFHEILAIWSEHIGGYKCFHDAINQYGVFEICSKFESYINERNDTRLRGSEMSIKGAFKKLLQFTEGELQIKRKVPLHVIMLCGIPGVGKSTLAQYIATIAENGNSPFRYIIILNKDQVAHDVAVREGIDNSSSKHKQRKLKAMIHHTLINILNKLLLLSLLHKGPGLLIMDACHAKVNTRRLWRNLLPKNLDSFRLIYVKCTNNSEHLQRLKERKNHDIITDISQAENALYVVKKAFVEPLEYEKCIQLDTSKFSKEEMAQNILSIFSEGKNYNTSVYNYRRAEEELKIMRKELIESIVGYFDKDISPLVLKPTKRLNKINIINIQLDISFKELLQIASEAIMSLINSNNSAISLWEKCKSVLGISKKRYNAVIEEGHTRWIQGWLFDRYETGKIFQINEWYKALDERFECKSIIPHITLFYDDSNLELPSSLIPIPGSIAEVTLSSILLDRSALCFNVKVVINGECYEKQISISETNIPLHVTIGHTPQVKASYTGMMFDIFQKWEIHNKDLDHMRRDASVKRSRLKYFNFLKARLTNSVCLRGVVVASKS